jgi:hypothetical protein
LKHRCGRAAEFVGCAASTTVALLVVFVGVVICAIFVLPFLLLFALDELIGERATTGVLTIVPPGPPQQPAAVPAWARRAA